MASNLVLAPKTTTKDTSKGQNLVNEKIDERILRLLGLEDVFDIDYDTYKTLLKERLAAARMSGSKIPAEEDQLIQEEFKRVKRNTGRFKIKKKKITAGDIKKSRNTNAKKISAGSSFGLLPPGKEEGPLDKILKSLDNIIGLLKDQNLLLKKQDELDRKRREKESRAQLEAGLEKGFKKAVDGAMKIIAPVKSVLQKIIDFFVAMFLGRALIKFLDWFGDPENKKKINAIGRFLKDNWPKLLALYLAFGTGLGRFVRTLSGLLIKGGIRLAAAAAGLLAKAGVGKAGKVASFLGGKKGKFLAAALQTGATVAGTMAVSGAIDKNFNQPPTQKFSGGGSVKFPAFAGGGFNFKGMMGGVGMGSMFGPLGMLLGGALGGTGGFVSGEKGVDKVPAMLSDGEFVMSRGAVAKYGVDTLESMNAAGGGTNRPKMMRGTTYAAGGGYIGTQEEKKEKVRDPILDKRQKEIDKMSGYSGGLAAERKEQLSQEGLSARLKRIEEQMQVQRALASGKGIDIKGAGLGSDIGKGFATSFMGREAIKVSLPPGGSYENEITLAGKRYFAMKRGNDILYVSNFAKGLAGQVDKYGARNKTYSGGGGGLMSGLSDKDKKNLPKTKIMMGPDGPFVGHLAYKNGEPTYQRPTQRKKGMLESLADFFNPKGAKAREETLNARTLRLTGISDLEDMRRRGMKEENIKKMLNERLGPNGYSRAVNDLKAKEIRIKKEAETDKVASAAAFGTSGDGLNKPKVSNLGTDYKAQELKLAAAASQPRVKPPAPPAKPPVVAKPATAGTKYQGGQRSGSGKPKTPNFGATCKTTDRPRTKKFLGIF
jgi:hypothetical protein